MAEKTKAYRIGDVPHYRRGQWYPPGSVVHIPEGEKASRTWTEVTDAKPAAPTPAPVDTNPKKRPSDRDVA